jgi:hypothetical protein
MSSRDQGLVDSISLIEMIRTDTSVLSLLPETIRGFVGNAVSPISETEDLNVEPTFGLSCTSHVQKDLWVKNTILGHSGRKRSNQQVTF